MADASSTQLERELTFDVPADWELPDLTRLAGKGGSVESGVLELASTYHDTAARDLLASRVTLRRRTGDADEGWQLKIPAGTPDRPARTEVRLPLGAGRGVPDELSRLTAGLRGEATLRPLATLRTRRTVRRIRDRVGRGLLEVVHDEVHATLHNAATDAVTWHEVEVELLEHGTERGLAAAASLLTRAGAQAAAVTSKLARAVGTTPVPAGPGPRGKGAAALTEYLAEQFAALVAGDVQLRRGADDATGSDDLVEVVHATRVATRRYRSTLRVFGAVFDAGDAAVRLDGELRWYAAVLGEVRDRHVLREHLLAAVDRLATAGTVGDVTPARRRIERALVAEESEARAALATAMDSPRYLELLSELRTWQSSPPVAGKVGRARLVRAADRAGATLQRRLADARSLDPDDPGRDERFHRARKASKRARYAAEVVLPLAGGHARSLRRDAKRWQGRLGDRQDEVVAAEFLHQLAQRPGRGTFVLGVLYQQQRELADTGADTPDP